MHLDYGSCFSLPEIRACRPGNETNLSSACQRLCNLTTQTPIFHPTYGVVIAPPIQTHEATDLPSVGVPYDYDLLALACATSGALTPDVAFGSPSLEKENIHAARRTRCGKYTSSFNKVASRILNTWFIRNQSCPYPTQETVKYLAEACNLEKEQVRKWFQNKRNRTGTSMKASSKNVTPRASVRL